MNRLIRSFLPVGQGIFYMEKFLLNGDEVNVVFDCGSSTGIKYINDQIDATFSDGAVIRAVFISHLHEDHINGLEHLLERCHVLKIYLPYLDEDERIILKYAYLNAGGNENDFTYKFINSPHDAVEEKQNTNRERLRIIEVPVSDGDSLEEGIPKNNVLSDIFQFGSFCSHDKEWKIIPQTFDSRKKSVFLNGLYNEFKKHYSAKDIPKLWNTDKQRIKKVYDALKGHYHTKSMVVYSGDGTDWYSQRRVKFCMPPCICHYECGRKYKAGCMYFGDIDCTSKTIYSQICKEYYTLFDSLGIITIPHHGASSSYNTDLTKDNRLLYIISAGNKNKYRHPNPTVIIDMLSKGITPLIVNEFQSSAVYTEVRL